MNENELKQNIARNITALRKQNNMTQAELAERLCYSDKSISKWERGDGLPDVYVLTRIAEMFGVTVNDIISETKDEPSVSPLRDTTTPRRVLVTILSAGVVWFVAALVFVILKIALPGADWLWLTFIAAVPVSAVVFVVFAHIWWGNLLRCISVSTLVWGVSIFIHLTMMIPNVENNKMIYIAAGVFQVLVVLWYVYRHWIKKYRTSEKNEAVFADAEENDKVGAVEDGKNE